MVVIAIPPLIGAGLFGLEVLRGLFGVSDHYWTSGCVTPDETTLAVTGDEAALIDLARGTIRVRFPGYFDDVVCLPGGEVLGLTPSEARSLTTRGTVVRSGSRPAAAVIDDRTILEVDRPVHRSTGASRRSEWSGPLELRTESFGPAARTSARVLLSPERLPGVGAGPLAWLETLFVRRLASGEALVVAGFRPTVLTSDPASWADGRRRGFYRVDTASGTAIQHGAALGAAEAACLLGSTGTTRTTASADGSVVYAACAAGEDRLKLLRLEPKSGTSAFIASFDEAREPSALTLSNAADRLAVATVASDGSSGRVAVVDATSGRVLFRTEPFRGWVYVLEWLRDGTLVLGTAAREYQRRDGTTGAVAWSATAPP